MNIERDKFLTELLGEVWMEINISGNHHYSINFSTWDSFGLLKDYVMSEESPYELYSCLVKSMLQSDPFYFIHPDIFADFIYEFMKDYKNEG